MSHPREETLSASDIAARLRVPLRTAQRRIASWRANGWPVVVRVAVHSRKWEQRVTAASFAAYLRGEPGPRAEADADDVAA